MGQLHPVRVGPFLLLRQLLQSLEILLAIQRIVAKSGQIYPFCMSAISLRIKTVAIPQFIEGAELQLLPSAENTSKARSMSTERKKTHPAQTKWKVKNPLINLPTTLGGRFLLLLSSIALSIASPPPCNKPQATKVQAAPCQRPPKSIVRRRFRYVRNFPLRFPPSPIYK